MWKWNVKANIIQAQKALVPISNVWQTVFISFKNVKLNCCFLCVCCTFWIADLVVVKQQNSWGVMLQNIFIYSMFSLKIYLQKIAVFKSSDLFPFVFSSLLNCLLWFLYKLSEPANETEIPMSGCLMVFEIDNFSCLLHFKYKQKQFSVHSAFNDHVCHLRFYIAETLLNIMENKWICGTQR